MAANKPIDFKALPPIIAWLDTALDKEKEKYRKCPVLPDYAPGHEVAQGWGYVVAGYFLVEQSLKALLYVRKKKARRIHFLSTLFYELDRNDKAILREYYGDFRATARGTIGRYPFETIDDFTPESRRRYG